MERPDQITKKHLNWLTYQIIGAGIEVHKHLGPGLLESVYEKALIHELRLSGFQVESQQPVLVEYKGVALNCEFRFDVLVEGLIIVENKSILQIPPVFEAKLLTYMKHCKVPKGIMLNFMVLNLYRDGTRTFVNDIFAALPER